MDKEQWIELYRNKPEEFGSKLHELKDTAFSINVLEAVTAEDLVKYQIGGQLKLEDFSFYPDLLKSKFVDFPEKFINIFKDNLLKSNKSAVSESDLLSLEILKRLKTEDSRGITSIANKEFFLIVSKFAKENPEYKEFVLKEFDNYLNNPRLEKFLYKVNIKELENFAGAEYATKFSDKLISDALVASKNKDTYQREQNVESLKMFNNANNLNNYLQLKDAYLKGILEFPDRFLVDKENNNLAFKQEIINNKDFLLKIANSVPYRTIRSAKEFEQSPYFKEVLEQAALNIGPKFSSTLLLQKKTKHYSTDLSPTFKIFDDDELHAIENRTKTYYANNWNNFSENSKKSYSDDLVKILNDRHALSDDKRFEILNDASTQMFFDLVKNTRQGDAYNSTYNYLLSNFLDKSAKEAGGAAKYINEYIHTNYSENDKSADRAFEFIETASKFGRLDDVFNAISPKEQIHLINLAVNYINHEFIYEATEHGVYKDHFSKRSLALIEKISKNVTNPDVIENLEGTLALNYLKHEYDADFNKQILFDKIALKHFSQHHTPSIPEFKETYAQITNNPDYKYEDFSTLTTVNSINKNGQHVQVNMFFDGTNFADKDFLKRYSDKSKWNTVDKGDYYLITNKDGNGKTDMFIYATKEIEGKEHSDEQAKAEEIFKKIQADIAKAAPGAKINLMAHRGHTMTAGIVADLTPEGTGLVIIGGCNSYNKIEKVNEKEYNSQFIGTLNTGVGVINNTITFGVNDAILNGKDIVWEDLKIKKINPINDSRKLDYVLPHEDFQNMGNRLYDKLKEKGENVVKEKAAPETQQSQPEIKRNDNDPSPSNEDKQDNKDNNFPKLGSLGVKTASDSYARNTPSSLADIKIPDSLKAGYKGNCSDVKLNVIVEDQTNQTTIKRT